MGKVLISLIVVATIFFLSACNTAGCLENQSSIPLAGFYSSASLKSISVDSLAIGGVGAPADSLLCNGNTSISQIYLPLRASRSETSFFIRYLNKDLDNPALYDTITFNYEASPFFASEECGAMYRYNITRCSYTSHLLDSIAILDSLITNINVQNIRIFFRTE